MGRTGHTAKEFYGKIFDWEITVVGDVAANNTAGHKLYNGGSSIGGNWKRRRRRKERSRGQKPGLSRGKSDRTGGKIVEMKSASRISKHGTG
ncbi:MAG: hypothetical protein NVS9B14_15630 [Candidatus Acidiferrum sp.]